MKEVTETTISENVNTSAGVKMAVKVTLKGAVDVTDPDIRAWKRKFTEMMNWMLTYGQGKLDFDSTLIVDGASLTVDKPNKQRQTLDFRVSLPCGGSDGFKRQTDLHALAGKKDAKFTMKLIEAPTAKKATGKKSAPKQPGEKTEKKKETAKK